MFFVRVFLLGGMFGFCVDEILNDDGRLLLLYTCLLPGYERDAPWVPGNNNADSRTRLELRQDKDTARGSFLFHQTTTPGSMFSTLLSLIIQASRICLIQMTVFVKEY